MNFLRDIYENMKKRNVRRLFYALQGGATTASIYLAGVIQGWLNAKAPMLVSHVDGAAIAAVLLGVFSSLIMWGFAKWLGKPIAQLQAEFGLERTGIAGEKFQGTLSDSVNCPNTFAMRNGDKIEIRKPRVIQE